jgi:dynein heavy chain
LFDIAEGFKNSSKETPIIFIITPGSDPLSDLKTFTERTTGRALQ